MLCQEHRFDYQNLGTHLSHMSSPSVKDVLEHAKKFEKQFDMAWITVTQKQEVK